MSSLYERIGGEAAVNAAVDLFYDKLLADPLLIPFFEGVDMARQRAHQKMFLTFAFGGPANYNGRDMRAGHARLVNDLGMSDVHFDAVVGHLGAALTELNVPGDLIAEAAGIAESVRNDVLNR